MNSWMNEAAAAQNHNASGFPHNMNDPNAVAGAGGMMDPSAFMTNPSQFNPAAASPGQFANPQQMAAAMQNGRMGAASPNFQNPVYQTNPVIPSKRPRPREESVGASPRQNPNMLPTSRADTPSQSQFPPGFQGGNMQGQPQQYSHLQANGSANASPSPVMAGNQLRPGNVPQRVNTASPHSFSPAQQQQFAPQTSPVPSEHGGTPQPNSYMQAQNMPQGFQQNFAPSPSPARPPSAQNMMGQQMMPQQIQQMGQQMQPQMHPQQMFNPQQMTPQQMQQMQQMQQIQQMQQAQGRGGVMDQQQRMIYQMRLQQQMQQQGNMQMAAQMQAQNMAQGRGMMPKQGMPMANGQMPPAAMRPQQPAQMNRGPDGFLKNLTQFMTQKQLPLDTNPSIEGRPLHLLQLFQNVSKFGGYQVIGARNMWAQVAASVGFNPQQVPSAPAQVKAIYEKNLLKFEEAWSQTQKQNQVKQQGMQGPPGQPGQQPQQQQQQQQRMGQMSPTQPMPPHQPPQQQQQQQMHQPPVQTPVKQMAQGMQQPAVNGFSSPQHPQGGPQQPPVGTPVHSRNSMSRSVDHGTMGVDFSMPSPAGSTKAGPMSATHPPHDVAMANGAATIPFPGPHAAHPDEYQPCSRELDPKSYGGLDLESVANLGIDLERWRPDVPMPHDMGMIDIHALTKSLQCGIHGEVRLALDTLVSVTRASETAQHFIIDLKYCDDLVETLIECAEEQVDDLVEQLEPVSDEIELKSYEDIMRDCRAETFALRKVTVFGESDYHLERAADRLIAVTTILRNLSFLEMNQPVLADETVIKFLCNVLRTLGTHENLLQSSPNCLDFMKDIIILLSNIAGYIELANRDQASCLLQVLLAFAPAPSPILADGKLVFAAFEPSVHQYLPHAVDALAKLLARDEPNRSHYKAIFAADATSSMPNELLTRTFALAISPVPEQNKESRPATLPSLIEARKPLLMQGLLAADILAQLAPGYESGVTRMWLSSGEGFAQNLYRMIRTLCTQAEPAVTRGNARSQPREDTDILYIISCGISALRRLGDKARDPNDPFSTPQTVLPTRDSVLSAFQSLKGPKWSNVLAHMSAYAGLDK